MEEHAPTQERRTKVCAAVHLDSEAKVVNLQKVCTVSVRSYSCCTKRMKFRFILQHLLLFLCFVADGGWGEWGEISSCTKTCGGGITTRTRKCDSPAPLNGGSECNGPADETRACATYSCEGIIQRATKLKVIFQRVGCRIFIRNDIFRCGARI